MSTLEEVLRRTRSVAVLGVSDRVNRPSFRVAAYLVDRTDWDVYLVNPHVDEVLGRPVYPSLDRLPVVPDLVDVFRRSTALGEVADAAIAVGAQTLWLQPGCSDPQVGRRAAAAGLDVVTGRCLKVEHARVFRTWPSPGGTGPPLR